MTNKGVGWSWVQRNLTLPRFLLVAPRSLRPLDRKACFFKTGFSFCRPHPTILPPLYDSGPERSLRKLIEDNKLVFSPLHLFILESPIEYDIVFFSGVFLYKSEQETPALCGITKQTFSKFLFNLASSLILYDFYSYVLLISIWWFRRLVYIKEPESINHGVNQFLHQTPVSSQLGGGWRSRPPHRDGDVRDRNDKAFSNINNKFHA